MYQTYSILQLNVIGYRLFQKHVSENVTRVGRRREGAGRTRPQVKQKAIFIHVYVSSLCLITMSLTVFIFVASQVKKHTVVHAVFNTSELKELSHC